MQKSFILIIPLFLISCAHGGIGLAGSPAWQMTASPQAKAAYYKGVGDKARIKCQAAGITSQSGVENCISAALDDKERRRRARGAAIRKSFEPKPVRPTIRCFSDGGGYTTCR